MSDEPETPVLDLGPSIVAKRQRDCKHERIVVDDALDYAECAACGAEVNPYIWIRAIADHENTERARLQEAIAQLWKDYRARHASLQAKLEHERAEVNHLIDVKNRLWSEPHPATGQPLGQLAARVRRRRVTAPR